MLALVLTLGITSVAFGDPVFINVQDGSRFEEELNERDWEALHEFVNTKRTIDVKEKAKNLTITGDVRFEWRHLYEEVNGHRLRGRNATTLGKPNARPDSILETEDEIIQDPTLLAEYGAPLPISRNDFDIECNLWFDYVCGRTWAVAQLQFDNSSGVDDEEDSCAVDPEGYHGSGKCNDICLKRAYFGYNLYSCDSGGRLDLEVGRRRLYNIFDSKIEFLSRFDGILLKYSSKWEMIADWYFQLAGFVVDERVDQFAWATEMGILNIMDSGFDFKYSLIDWQKFGTNRCLRHADEENSDDPFKNPLLCPVLRRHNCYTRNPRGFKYVVSQFLVYYHLNPEWLCKPAYLYGAFLINHAQPKTLLERERRHHKHHKHHKDFFSVRANMGWYLGFNIGEVVKEGDWAFNIEYQVVQAFAIPDGDVAGISNGNVLDNSITARFHRGNTNYEGWRLEGLYAVTDNLTLDSIIEWTREYDKKIGGRHHYSKFELEAIYAF